MTMADKLIYIPNDDAQNNWFKRLNTIIDNSTNNYSLKSPKILNQRIRKRYYKTLGTKKQ